MGENELRWLQITQLSVLYMYMHAYMYDLGGMVHTELDSYNNYFTTEFNTKEDSLTGKRT